jgi:pimeloyl-ACP methyl ester carboxylesterase
VGADGVEPAAGRGAHRPALVMLPGLDGSGQLFGPFSACVADILDPQPVGYPSNRLWGYEDLLPFVRERLPDGPSVVLGESFSGPLAVMLADALPAQVSAVVLVSSFARLPLPPRAAWLAGRVEAARCPQWLTAFALTDQTTPPAMREELSRQARALAPPLVERRLRAVFGVDVRPTLDRLRCPVLAVHGRGDRLVPLWWARRDLGRCRGVTFQAVAGPHMLLQSVPQAVARCIAAWLPMRRNA